MAIPAAFAVPHGYGQTPLSQTLFTKPQAKPMNTNQHWSLTLRILHWLIAILIIEQLISGFIAEDLPLSKAKLDWFWWHKSLGMLVLGLVALRIASRLLSARPPLPNTTRFIALTQSITHIFLYLGMLALPLSGWVINASSGFPFKVFGLWKLPAIVEKSNEIKHIAITIHGFSAWLMAGLIALHLAGALWHQLILRDRVLKQMLYGR